MKKILFMCLLCVFALALMGEDVLFEDPFYEEASEEWSTWWTDNPFEVVDSDTDWRGEEIEPRDGGDGYFLKTEYSGEVWGSHGVHTGDVDDANLALETYVYMSETDSAAVTPQLVAFFKEAGGDYLRIQFRWRDDRQFDAENVVRVQGYCGAIEDWFTVHLDSYQDNENEGIFDEEGWYQVEAIIEEGPIVSIYVDENYVGTADVSGADIDKEGSFGLASFSYGNHYDGEYGTGSEQQVYWDDFVASTHEEEYEPQYDYYLAASFGEEMGGSEWSADDPDLGLTDWNDTGVYTISHTLDEDLEAIAPDDGWKITDGTWDNDWPNSNLSFVAEEGEEVTFYMDTNDYSEEDNFMPETHIVYSSNLSERTEPAEPNVRGSLTDPEWNEDDDTYTFDLVDDDGNYYTTHTAAEDGVIEWKVASIGEWDSFDILEDNQTIDVEEGDEVYFYMHPDVNRFKATTTPLFIEDWAEIE